MSSTDVKNKLNPRSRIVIEGIAPVVDGGRFAVKAVAGDVIKVSADIWKDGHEQLLAAVFWRKLAPRELLCGEEARPPREKAKWREARLTSRFEDNDRWFGELVVDEIGPWVFTVGAWTDLFGTWRSELKKKLGAGLKVESELTEGMAIIARTLAHAKGEEKKALARAQAELERAKSDKERARLALLPELAALMERNDPRVDLELYAKELPLWVDRERGRFGAWYELFPRSYGGTFRAAESRLAKVADMGFDVVYLPPIHPIGVTARKGKNNTERALRGDPGSPWAIGNADGGHDAVHRELGTIEDFDHYVATARRLGMEIALDFAVQCSPDHPWVKEHPQWFSHRPDGTIKYAENPPKKYQDIFPINFDTEDRDGLYHALLTIVRFWIAHGVEIFRVDNPHTKPHSFWEWLITEVHREHPEVLFLAEAFTRPKRMLRLAKLGFTQSYSYFTWRNTREELEQYARELFSTDLRLVMRPNFFPNTPDILHEYLQRGGRPAFIVRLVLAATLSPTYGIYSGFELCENTPLRPGSEEYLNSEKYEIRVRDFHAPGNLSSIIKELNHARREHRALQLADNLELQETNNRELFAYAKSHEDSGDHILCVVNLDPHNPQEGLVRVPEALHQGRHAYRVRDLLTGEVFSWQGPYGYVRLDPHRMPAHVLQLMG